MENDTAVKHVHFQNSRKRDEHRTKIALASTSPEDLVSCATIAVSLRKANIVTFSPIKHSAIKKQLSRLDDFNPAIVVIVNASNAIIRYFNEPCQIECPLDKVVPILLELDFDDTLYDDQTIIDLSTSLLRQSYVFHNGCEPAWSI